MGVRNNYVWLPSGHLTRRCGSGRGSNTTRGHSHRGGTGRGRGSPHGRGVAGAHGAYRGPAVGDVNPGDE